jgi:hypothetical protein|tara:strand:- start:67 stop:957 length:891 start_codon:yes stop_codon:yes gene_type:complete
MSKLPTVATLWIGDRLSWLEQLSLKSFVDAGHETLLYCYEKIPNSPQGVTIRDAREVFPGDEIIRHKGTGSPAIHADLWRLHLMQQTDYIWVDTDVLCTRPFDFKNPFVFGLEKPKLICNAVMRLPSDSETLKGLLEFISDPYAIGGWLKPEQQLELQASKDRGEPVHFSEQAWGLTGPAALSYYLKETGEWEHALPQSTFYPVSFKDRNKMIKRRFDIEKDFLTSDTYAVHMWARRMKPRLEEAENNRPGGGSYMDNALKKHGITPLDAPIPPRKKPLASESDNDRLIAENPLEL